MSFNFGPMQNGKLVHDLGKDHEFVVAIRGKITGEQYTWWQSITTQNTYKLSESVPLKWRYLN